MIVSPGTQCLRAHEAATLQIARAGRLRVRSGRLWVTFALRRATPGQCLGDHVVAAGQTLAVRAGERLVVEPFDRVGAVLFVFEPLAAPVRQHGRRQALADLARAATLAIDALGRLLGAGHGTRQLLLKK